MKKADVFVFSDKMRRLFEEKNVRLLDAEKRDDQFYAKLEWFSPAGENFVWTEWFNDEKEFVASLVEHAETFDVDDYCELRIDHRGENGVPKRISDVLKDAEAIQTFLFDLAEAAGCMLNPNSEPLREFEVSIRVEGRFYCNVNAKDFEEAKRKGEELFVSADIGDLECVEWKAVNATDTETEEIHDFC